MASKSEGDSAGSNSDERPGRVGYPSGRRLPSVQLLLMSKDVGLWPGALSPSLAEGVEMSIQLFYLRLGPIVSWLMHDDAVP